MSDEVRPDQGGEGYEWEGEPDLTSISEDELKARLKDLDEEKRALSYRRRVLQGRIDLIRAELVWRGGVLMSGESNRFGRTEGEGGV
jgi:hypothetical protein